MSDLILNDEVKCPSYPYRSAELPAVTVMKNPRGKVVQTLRHNDHDWMRFTVPFSQMDDTQKDTFINFGKAIGWVEENFLWNDLHGDGNFITRQSIGTGDGSEDDFQIIQTRAITGSFRDYARWDIGEAPDVLVSPKVWVATVLKTEGVHYNINYTTGIITFVPGQEPGMGEDVECECYYYRRVRFLMDYAWEFATYNDNSILAIMDEEDGRT